MHCHISSLRGLQQASEPCLDFELHTVAAVAERQREERQKDHA